MNFDLSKLKNTLSSHSYSCTETDVKQEQTLHYLIPACLICVQMSGLCWTAVMLTVVLSAGTSFAAVDKTQLANIVKFIMDK